MPLASGPNEAHSVRNRSAAVREFELAAMLGNRLVQSNPIDDDAPLAISRQAWKSSGQNNPMDNDAPLAQFWNP